MIIIIITIIIIFLKTQLFTLYLQIIETDDIKGKKKWVNVIIIIIIIIITTIIIMKMIIIMIMIIIIKYIKEIEIDIIGNKSLKFFKITNSMMQRH